MREFAPLGVEWVANALRLSEELEVDETGSNVRRTKEIQEPKGQFERSIYAVSVHSSKLSCTLTYWSFRKVLERKNLASSKS